MKLSPDLEESIAVMLPRSPEMLRPCEPVLLALSGREGLRKPLLDRPEVLTLGLLPYTHLCINPHLRNMGGGGVGLHNMLCQLAQSCCLNIMQVLRDHAGSRC